MFHLLTDLITYNLTKEFRLPPKWTFIPTKHKNSYIAKYTVLQVISIWYVHMAT